NPQVDFVAGYGLVGRGGTQLTRSGKGLGGWRMMNTVRGGYLDSLRRMVTNDDPSSNAQVKVSYPLGPSGWGGDGAGADSPERLGATANPAAPTQMPPPTRRRVVNRAAEVVRAAAGPAAVDSAGAGLVDSAGPVGPAAAVDRVSRSRWKWRLLNAAT